MSIAYALRAEHADTFAGAVLCAGPNGESMDTAERLQEGNGVIVVEDGDTYAITALDAHPQFERVADAAKPRGRRARSADTAAEPPQNTDDEKGE